MATIKKTALVIGAGTGGYPCAIRLGQLGVDAMLVEIGNGRWTGGGMRVLPNAVMNDGLLDVCIFAPRTLPDVATVLWKVARRQYVGDDRMIYLQAREVSVDADPPIITQVDGDCTGNTPLTARAVAGGVKVLMPTAAS